MPGECMVAKCFGGALSLRDRAAQVLNTLSRRAALALLAVAATALAAHAQGADTFPYSLPGGYWIARFRGR
jgi:hypothetical protein